MARASFRLAYGLLAAILAASGVLFYAQLRPVAHAGSVCSTAAPHDPLVATKQFVATAVARVHVERSYGLVAPALRQGMSCAEWRTGTIPVQPFLEVVAAQTRYRVIQRKRDERMVLVHLVSRSRDWGETTFVLELRQQDGGWRASSWTPAGGMSVPAAA